MASQEEFDRILQRLMTAQLSSIASLRELYSAPLGTPLGANRGSENYALWSEMAKLEWLAEVPLNMSSNAADRFPDLTTFKTLEGGHAEIGRLLEVLAQRRELKQKFVLTIKNPAIGFMSFDPSATELMKEDKEALAPLFSRCEAGPTYQVPCHILFLYGKVRADGFIENSQRHVRDIAKGVHASIVVLASENSGDVLLQRGFPWRDRTHWAANIVFVNNRKGPAFAKFFQKLFDLMFEGKDFALSWVHLVPQVPPASRPQSNEPGMIMALECKFILKKDEGAPTKVAQDVMEDAAYNFMKDSAWHMKVTDEALKIVQAIDADKDRVHIETLLSRLGAMAGFGCMEGMRVGVKSGRIKIEPENKTAIITIRKKEDPHAYVYGDLINQFVAEADISVIKFISGAVEKTGAPMLDTGAIFRNIVSTIGHKGYGTFDTQVPDQHWPHERPIETIKKHAIAIMKVIAGRMDPLHAGWYFAWAGQKVILENRDRLSPAIAAQIFLEAAIAMSKLDPAAVFPPNPAA